MSRFDYIKYDRGATEDQETAKGLVKKLESMIESIGYALPTPDERKYCGRSKSLALTKLEECYMWIGKALRDDQMARGVHSPLQEERKDG